MTIKFQGGRLPNNPDKPRLILGNYLTTVQSADKADWYSRVNEFPMYKNDAIGDCTAAGVGHIINAVTTYGQGQEAEPSEETIVSLYSATSGYDPSTGANDNGAVMQDVLNYWRKNGVDGHQILAFAEVDKSNLDEVYAALELFGNLYIGINFPASAMDQFNANEPWSVVNGAKLEGGHAIHGGGYDKTTKTWNITTWGKVQVMNQDFFDKYVEEIWVVVSPEWINSNNTNPAGIDVNALGNDFTTLTGEANPFPSVNPAPTPEPSIAEKVLDKVEAVFEELETFIKSL